MFRSGYILILASLSPWTARATAFDYARFVGADARVCERNLTVDRPPTVIEPIGHYVENLSVLKFESEFHADVSVGAAGGRLSALLHPPSNSGDVDLVTMRRMSLALTIVKNKLGIIYGSSLIYMTPFTEPLYGVRAVRENSRGGYLTLIGWTRSLTLRLQDGRLYPAPQSPFDPPTHAYVTPLRDHEDPALEVARLAAHAARPPTVGALPPSVLREALGQLTEQMLDRASSICRGDGTRGGLIGGTYPNSLLALAALALAGDVGTRALIASGINEHPAAGWVIRVANESNGRPTTDAGALVFTLHSPACPTLRFVVPDEPFLNADGWAYLR